MTARSVHRWLAWALALPLLWLSLSGALLGFAAEMDRIMHVELMTTPMSQQPTLSETIQRNLIAQAYPAYQWLSFSLAQNPVDTSLAVMQDDTGRAWQIFLNPKLGVINGVRPLESDWKLVLTDWHKFGFFPKPWGEWVAAVSTVLSLAVVISGWAQSRHQGQSNYSLHRLAGQWASPLLGVLLVSGLLLFAQSVDWISASLDWASVHQGDWLGMPGRLLWVLLSLLLAWLVIGGLWLVSTHKKDY